METDLEVPKLDKGVKYHCFVAFSFEEKNIADAVVLYLRSKDFKVSICTDFIGNNLLDNIANCAKESRRVVILMSKNYLKSDFYNHETLLFIHNNHTHQCQQIIPVCVDLTEEEMKDTRLGLYTYHYIDYQGTDNALQKIAKAVAGPDVPLNVFLPCGNVAQGLVWSYYYGYLKIILPGMRDRCRKSEFSQDENIPLVPVVFILVPDTGKCHNEISDCDPNITMAGHLEGVTANRGGIVRRSYKNTIYKIRGPNGEEYYAPCEYATPVLSMYEMCEDQFVQLSVEEKMHQIGEFSRQLGNLLAHSPVSDGLGIFRIINFKAGEDGRSNVSSLIVKEILKDQKMYEKAQSRLAALRLLTPC